MHYMPTTLVTIYAMSYIAAQEPERYVMELMLDNTQLSLNGGGSSSIVVLPVLLPDMDASWEHGPVFFSLLIRILDATTLVIPSFVMAALDRHRTWLWVLVCLVHVSWGPRRHGSLLEAEFSLRVTWRRGHCNGLQHP